MSRPNFIRALLMGWSVVSLVACGTRTPAAKDFTLPANGTLMQGGHEETVQPVVPAGQSGALVVNQTGFPIQVAVSNTIASLPIGHDFLFSLPPGAYEFYIYEPDSVPRVHTEKLEDGRLRYLYITRWGNPGG